MPQISKTFEFYNPWSTPNSHTTQASIQMPQMVNGRRPDPVLTICSQPIEGGWRYFLGDTERAVNYTVAYTIEGAFKGALIIQSSVTPTPGENNWTDIIETLVEYTGTETTGGAGISGGFSGAVSRPTRTNSVNFTGSYLWLRAKLAISRGTLQSIKLHF